MPTSRRSTSTAPRIALLLVPLALALGGAATAQCPPVPEASFVSASTDKLDGIGKSVALDGDFLVAGAVGHEAAGTDVGAVHVFHRGADGAWQDVATLVPSNPVTFSNFGFHVAISGDVIAAVTESVSLTVPDRLHVFERTGPGPGDWTEVLSLADPSWTPGGFSFLDAVAVEGDTILLGQHLDSDVLEEAGSVLVLERTAPGTWLQKGTLAAPTPLPHGHFGSAVAIEGDLVLVGAEGDREIWLPVQHGSAHLFRRDPAAPAGWSHVTELPATVDTFGTDYGCAVEIGGSRLFVGASGNFFTDVDGVLEIFEQDPAGSWRSAHVLKQSKDIAVDVEFYASEVRWSDGYLAVTAPSFAGVGPVPISALGAVYLYHEDAGGPGAFGLVDLVLPPIVDAGYQFAAAAAAQDGLLVVGAPGDDARCGTDLGPFGQCNYGMIHTYALEPDAPLAAHPAAISLAAGGAQTIEVREGSCFAGRLSLLAGSASGTSPGLALGPWNVPLNPDGYFHASVLLAGTAPFVGTLAVLDAAGGATSSIVVPPGLPPALAGLVLHHANAVLDAASLAVLDVSPAVSLTLAP